MPVRETVHTRRPARAEVRGDEVREETVAETEPMRIWPHPICCGQPEPCPQDQGGACPDLGPVLEQLQCQSQLLLDLLGAVNALTAALLCKKDRE